jgi:putative FmdB family regulatory protein
MPLYEFYCEKCGFRFTERQTIVEHGQNRPECPRCHSDERVRAELSTFHAVTSRKS